MKIIYGFFFTIVIAIGYSQRSLAHPVSFKGGTSLMSELSDQRREVSLIYSIDWNKSFGVVLEDMEDLGTMTSLQFAWLMKRWNLSDAQGNIYVFGGPGTFNNSKDYVPEDENSDLFMRYGLQADFETRSFYSLIRFSENRDLGSNTSYFNTLDLKLGFATHIANYDDLNSWIILHIRTNTKTNQANIIPTLRFYLNSFLWELAQDFQGNSYLNFMTRF